MPSSILRGVNEHWSVTVTRNGESVIAIESNCLAGRELNPADVRAILMAARHLASFVAGLHGLELEPDR